MPALTVLGDETSTGKPFKKLLKYIGVFVDDSVIDRAVDHGVRFRLGVALDHFNHPVPLGEVVFGVELNPPDRAVAYW